MELRWIKVDKMEEEKLGMGKTEVSEVLKVSRTIGLFRELEICTEAGRH